MEQDKVNKSTTDLIDAVRDIFATEVAKDTTAAAQLKRVPDCLTALRPDPERTQPAQQPVCQTGRASRRERV